MRSCCQRIFFIYLLLFAAMSNALAQPKATVEHYSTEQGLSHQRIVTILKDYEGFMWFGTWDGINRFDGHSFVGYKTTPRDTYQLSSNRIDRIVEDQANHLWVQTSDDQIYRFDKRTHQFFPLAAALRLPNDTKIAFSNILLASGGYVWLQSEKEGIFCVSQTAMTKENVFHYKKEADPDFRLPSNAVNFLHQDKEHRIWIGTSEGLCCLAPSKTGIFTNNGLVPAGFASNVYFTKCTEDEGHLYFATADGSLIVFDKKSKNFIVRQITAGRINALLLSKKKAVVYAATSLGEIVSVNLTNLQTTTARYPSAQNFYSLFEEQSGAVWVQPEKFGAIRFDPQANFFQLFFLNEGKSVPDPAGRFSRVVEDRNGTVWVVMKGGGFGYYNPASKKLESVLYSNDTTRYHLPPVVNNIVYDEAGILWLTVNQRELVKIVLQESDFRKQILVSNKTPQIASEVKGIAYDAKGRLWLGAKNDNLYVYQNNALLTNLFVNPPATGMPDVYAILHDSRGNVWLGTKGNGLFKAVPANAERTKYNLTHFAPDKNNPESLPCNQIYSLVEDRKGRVWIGSADNGLVLVEEDGQETRFVQAGNLLLNHPKEAFQSIRHMALDKDGNLWIGTTNGLLLVDINDHHSTPYQYKIYRTIAGNSQSLGNNDIQYVYQDAKSRMWLATSGGGFCQAIGEKPFQALHFRNFTTKDGLPNDYVLSCVEDRQGNFWLATENGLSKFNPEANTFRNYSTQDGLPKLAFSEGSVATKGPGESIFFGTTTGYLAFEPERIKVVPIIGNIAFTNLQINNEDVGPNASNKIVAEDVNYISHLMLQHNQNIISIAYTILDYRGSEKQPLAYRLLGFDSTWHEDRDVRRATYTNLPPGDYVFEVKSLSTDLYSNRPYKQLAITILPPWWKTWWAYLLYVVVAVALVYTIWQYAIAMIRLRNKIAVEQKLAALKMNFFTNISHELRTPLTLIINPLEQVANKGNLTPELRGYLEVARKNAGRMVRFVNQLLDLRKVQSDKATLRISRVEMVSFVKNISGHFTEAVLHKNITLEILSDGEELFVWVDAEKIDVIIYNLLGNAFKFTPEGKRIKVFIESNPETQQFYIRVHDQGPGVPKEQLEAIFELFYEGDTVNNRQAKGTGIGLALSKEFVSLHGGAIWAENNEDGGLTVTLKLKMRPEYAPVQNNSPAALPKTDNVTGATETQSFLPVNEVGEIRKEQEAPLLLLVEDNDELRTFIRSQLEEHYRVETAKDGGEGLQKAIELVPDLIVSDIMMPKMDGIQMLDRIKNNENTSHVPVVLLSAKYAIESQIEGLKYGADYYITKPFNSDFLMASIENLLNQRKKLFESLVEKKKLITPEPKSAVITSKDELFLKEVIKIVEEKLGDANFKIDEVAESMAMSHKTFSRKFRSLAGQTPVEFVRDLRLQKAKQLLDAGGGNISEVAYEVGFSVPSYFSTCFKEKYQVSPSDYIKARTT